ncbi:MAG TPA: type III pantothenate kinase, partial [Clostridiales bacterium]|nr:type III pantothenate kinase [Clostridiales bacterium]
GIAFRDIFSAHGYTFQDVDGIIISSVVPTLNYTIEHACTYYMNIKPMMIDATVKTGLSIGYTVPKTIGADRIASSTAAFHLYGAPAIVVDMGTATTFNAISRDGVLLGGAIAPGIKTSLDALVSRASQLPLVELSLPDSPIGTNTITSMQSGIIYGYRGLVENIVKEFKKEIGEDAHVVATGGLTSVILSEKNDFIDYYDRALTLKGLQIIYALNH